jgi:hypothetical protein
VSENFLPLVICSFLCRGPDINLDTKQEDMDDDDDDDDDKTKCWSNGTDAEKSKTEQQLLGESLITHILREVIF